MAGDATVVVVHFKDGVRNEELEQALERRCRSLADEFHETTRFEISIAPESNVFSAHAKVRGKGTDVASHANAPEARQAADAALDRLERELRKDHDKRIFTPRREAKRNKAKRSS